MSKIGDVLDLNGLLSLSIFEHLNLVPEDSFNGRFSIKLILTHIWFVGPDRLYQGIDLTHQEGSHSTLVFGELLLYLLFVLLLA